MTTTIDASRPSEPEQTVRKHPIRGAIWGLLLGLGIAIYAVLFRIVPFGDWVPLGLCVLAGIALGVLWAYVAPATGPKERPPAGTDTPDETDAPDEADAADTTDETDTPDEADAADTTDEADTADEDV